MTGPSECGQWVADPRPTEERWLTSARKARHVCILAPSHGDERHLTIDGWIWTAADPTPRKQGTSRGRRTQQRAEERRVLRQQRTGSATLPVPEHIRALTDNTKDGRQ